ncbi:MAG: serine acetyltransferase [Bacteroidales bacterium]|jgi:sugar O-acyltransferase (sialic acid O-acetyltransferase NeuD family)|nr:serine acetyltransferase [Bacteroidales bacterium]
MKDIAIYGGGGFSKEIACLINCINEKEPVWNFIGFFNRDKKIGEENEYGKVLGDIPELNAWESELNIVIAIGNPESVFKVASEIKNDNIVFPNLFSPDTVFLDKNNISFGKGNIICVGCSFSCNVKIGDFNIFNGRINIGHDVSIGNFNALMPSVKISGNVSIGNRNFFGVSSVVLQKMKIGNQVRLGASSVLMTKVKDGNSYVGNPATIFKF